MSEDVMELLGIVVNDDETITLGELCQCCALPAEQVITMIEQGIIEPLETRASGANRQFPAQSVLRVQKTVRLQRDLGVNLAGAALALDLLDEIKSLRQLVAALERSE